MARSTPPIGDLALDMSDLVLSTLANAAQLTPVPYLQNAANLALSIFNTIQGMRQNKSAFRRLGNDATLHEIERYTMEQASKHIVFRFIQSKSDAGAIQEYRERLTQSLAVFNVKSSLSMQDSLGLIHQKLAGIQDAVQHGGQAEVWDGVELGRVKHQRQEREKLEAERLEAERLEAERLEAERLEAERLEVERLEAERLEAERLEHERARTQRLEREAYEKQETERERIAHLAHLERERIEKQGPGNEWNPWAGAATIHPQQTGSETPRVPQVQGGSIQTNPFRQAMPSDSGSRVHHPASGPILHLPHAVPALSLPYLIPPASQDGNIYLLNIPHHRPSTSSYIPRLQSASLGGDYKIYANSVVNSNSGNVTFNTVSNSHNDTSVRIC
ncbi:hypothetical protein DXG01_003527 [Tephrocybe rancida]|nr:hypothetical protein DXG01_003527 [Tephrocybe rancida]